MLEIQMLGNPNLVADGENCLEEVKEIDQYLINLRVKLLSLLIVTHLMKKV